MSLTYLQITVRAPADTDALTRIKTLVRLVLALKVGCRRQFTAIWSLCHPAAARARACKAASLKPIRSGAFSLRNAVITDYRADVSGGGVTATASGWLRGAAAPRSANGTQDTLTSPFTKVWQAMR
jgi:hypothetical protein